MRLDDEDERNFYLNETANEYTFTLDGHESALFHLFFVKRDQTEYKREKPFQMTLHVKDNSPDYE